MKALTFVSLIEIGPIVFESYGRLKLATLTGHVNNTLVCVRVFLGC